MHIFSMRDKNLVQLNIMIFYIFFTLILEMPMMFALSVKYRKNAAGIVETNSNNMSKNSPCCSKIILNSVPYSLNLDFRILSHKNVTFCPQFCVKWPYLSQSRPVLLTWSWCTFASPDKSVQMRLFLRQILAVFHRQHAGFSCH